SAHRKTRRSRAVACRSGRSRAVPRLARKANAATAHIAMASVASRNGAPTMAPTAMSLPCAPCRTATTGISDSGSAVATAASTLPTAPWPRPRRTPTHSIALVNTNEPATMTAKLTTSSTPTGMRVQSALTTRQVRRSPAPVTERPRVSAGPAAALLPARAQSAFGQGRGDRVPQIDVELVVVDVDGGAAPGLVMAAPVLVDAVVAGPHGGGHVRAQRGGLRVPARVVDHVGLGHRPGRRDQVG